MSGLAKATIYKLVHQGRLREFRVLNRTLRFDPVDIIALVRELPVDSSATYTTLDGANAYNPLKEVPKFEEPRPTPKWLPYEVIEKTFAVMRECPTKARLMLIAYAGFRPSEVMRATPEDVLPYLDLPEPFCFKRVGKGGVPVMVPLPKEGVAAWRLLIANDAWGRFQHANVNRDWKHAHAAGRRDRDSWRNRERRGARGHREDSHDVQVRQLLPFAAQLLSPLAARVW